jgi:osmotically-inducible protein OsmY
VAWKLLFVWAPTKGEADMTIGMLSRIRSLVTPGSWSTVDGRLAHSEFTRMQTEISDTLISAAVKVAISRDPGLRAAGIHVATWRSVVQLSGFVESRHVISRALAIVRGVRDVGGVRNDMRLK